MTPESWNSSLLGNGSVSTFSRKRTLETIEEAVFSVGTALRLYNEDFMQLEGELKIELSSEVGSCSRELRESAVEGD
jgi:phage terminase small subunit